MNKKLAVSLNRGGNRIKVRGGGLLDLFRGKKNPDLGTKRRAEIVLLNLSGGCEGPAPPLSLKNFVIKVKQISKICLSGCPNRHSDIRRKELINEKECNFKIYLTIK